MKPLSYGVNVKTWPEELMLVNSLRNHGIIVDRLHLTIKVPFPYEELTLEERRILWRLKLKYRFKDAVQD